MNDSKNFDWNELLARIDAGDVIPIIGQNLYRVQTETGKEVLLYPYLAEQLAESIDFHPGEDDLTFDRVVHHYLKVNSNDFLKENSNDFLKENSKDFLKENSKDFRGLRRFLSERIATLRPVPAGPLWKLAQIKPFSLFINTTYDPFLENTLNAVRDYPTTVLNHTYMENRLRNVTNEMIGDMEAQLHSLVVNIYGGISKNFSPAYREDDISETLEKITGDMRVDVTNPLFQMLKEKRLLFLGCGYSYSMYRRLIRTISDESYQKSDYPRVFIVDDFRFFSNGEMSRFYESYGASVCFRNNEIAFMDMLFTRLEGYSPQHIIPVEKFTKFSGTVFVSFHGADRVAARQLASHLRQDGIDVWLDEERIRPGDEVNRTIVEAISRCRVFIPIISNNARKVQSGGDDQINYHIQEWEWAYSQKVAGKNPRIIIPVNIDGVDWLYRNFSNEYFVHIPDGMRQGGYVSLKDRLLGLGETAETIPLEINSRGEKAVKVRADALERGKNRSVNEVKVLLIGDGGAGKTSLLKRLMRKKFDMNEKRTHGINIEYLSIKDETIDETEIKARIWDFGGQEIYHATHQFFLSKRSFYILVLDVRRDEKPDYWLKHIETFGGYSPVMVVLNKIDENPGFEVNRKYLKEKFKNISSFHRISCKTEEGIDEFIADLRHALIQYEVVATPWPSKWFNIKEQLEEMPQNFISYQEYCTFCNHEGVKKESDQIELLNYLNDLGIILHFEDFQIKKDIQVLKPKWVTEGVYKIINSRIVASNKGILRLESIEEIFTSEGLSTREYPPDMHKYFIELMKLFELCYPIDRGQILVITDLLDVEECEFDFDVKKALNFIFEYDFLPKNVISRFIARLHGDIKRDKNQELRWRTGVVLKAKNFNATALVKSDEEKNRIFIFVEGEHRRYYFSIIRNIFKEIHGDFVNLAVSELIPLPDTNGLTVDYYELIACEIQGVKDYRIAKLKMIYSVKTLLDGLEEEKERAKKYPAEVGNNTINIYGETNLHVGKKEETYMAKTEVNVGGDLNNQGGNLIIGNKNLQSGNQTNSSIEAGDLKILLREFEELVEKMVQKLPGQDSAQVSRDVKAFLEEIKSEKPRQRWWELNANGIKEAAKTMGKLGVSVVTKLDTIIPLLAKYFK